MCGIVGVLSTEGFVESDKRKKFLMQSLYVDALRGWDSTGVFVAGSKNTDKKELFYKRALPSYDFMVQRPVQRLINDMANYSFAIGHNRAATKGSIDDSTAHPFVTKNLIGVHNGTLYGHHNLPGAKNIAVDSEAIFNAFQLEGEHEVIEQLDGAFALVWFDNRDRKLKLVRNSERPLHIAGVKGKDTILIASEKEMLRWISQRNQIEIEGIEMISVGEIYSFNNKKVKDFTKEKVELHKVKSYNNVYNGNFKKGKRKSGDKILSEISMKKGDTIQFIISGWRPYQGNSERGTIEGYMDIHPYFQIEAFNVELDFDSVGDEVEAVISSAYMDNDGYEVITVKDIKKKDQTSTQSKEIIYYGTRGEVISKNKFDELTKHGCVMCQGNILPQHSGKIAWTYEGDPLCPDCVKSMGYERLVPVCEGNE